MPNEKHDSHAFTWMKQIYDTCPFTGKRSWRTINRCLAQALNVAIEIDMKFAKEDFQRFGSEMHFSYWAGTSTWQTNGELFYNHAVSHGNNSACVSFEAFVHREPFLFGRNRRAAPGQTLFEDGDYHKPLVVTSFSKDGEFINLAHFDKDTRTAIRRVHVSRSEFRQRRWEVPFRNG